MVFQYLANVTRRISSGGEGSTQVTDVGLEIAPLEVRQGVNIKLELEQLRSSA